MNIAIKHVIINNNYIDKHLFISSNITLFAILQLKIKYVVKKLYSTTRKNNLLFNNSIVIVLRKLIAHNIQYCYIYDYLRYYFTSLLLVFLNNLIRFRYITHLNKSIYTNLFTNISSNIYTFIAAIKVMCLIVYQILVFIIIRRVIMQFTLLMIFSISCFATQSDKVNLYKNDIITGDPEAKILFIEYFAPTCSHCTEYHLKVFPEIKSKYVDSGKIAYVQRECISNRQDLDASLLARCKGDKESYLKIMHRVVTTQDAWAYSKDYIKKLTQIAKDYNISESEYELCRNDKTKLETIINISKSVFNDRDFLGTPSFYINGVLFSGNLSIDALSKQIENQLKKEVSG